jgi:hypothetical protein
MKNNTLSDSNHRIFQQVVKMDRRKFRKCSTKTGYWKRLSTGEKALLKPTKKKTNYYFWFYSTEIPSYQAQLCL